MLNIKHGAVLTLLLVCFTAVDLRFRKINDPKYRGLNVAGDKVTRIGNIDNPDNILCFSKKFVGLIDGESPLVTVRKGPEEKPEMFSFSPFYLATMVADQLFTSKKGDLLDGPIQSNENAESIQTEILNSFNNEITAVLTQYRGNLEQLSDPHPSDLAKSSLLKDEVLKMNSAVEESRQKESMASDQKLSEATANKADGITNFQRSVNSGVAAVAVRLVNTASQAKKNGPDVEATLSGVQMGRSFVAVLRRHEFMNAETKKEKNKRFFTYRLNDYRQYSFGYMTRLYPEPRTSMKIKDVKLEEVEHFNFKVKRGDIVLVADANLIDNFSYAFIELLINYSLWRQANGITTSLKNDPTLVDLVSQYVQKMGDPNTIKTAFKVVTQNNAYSKADETTGKEGLEACKLRNFFYFDGSFNSAPEKFSDGTSCVRNYGRWKFPLSCDKDDFDKADEAIMDKFDPTDVNGVLREANRLIQDFPEKGTGSGINTTPFKSFLTYRHIINWRIQMNRYKAHLQKKKNTPAPPNPTYFGANYIDQEIAKKQFAPAQGDLTVYANILVEKDYAEKGQDISRMMCTHSVNDKSDGQFKPVNTAEMGEKIIEFCKKTAESDNIANIYRRVQVLVKDALAQISKISFHAEEDYFTGVEIDFFRDLPAAKEERQVI